MKLLRRAIAALFMASLAAVVLRVRGRGGVPPNGGVDFLCRSGQRPNKQMQLTGRSAQGSARALVSGGSAEEAIDLCGRMLHSARS